MLKSKILPVEAYERFMTYNQANNGAHVDRAYLQDATIRVFYYPDAPEQWVAAYVINTQAPFRYLSVLTDERRSTLLQKHGMAENRLVEITLLCRDRTIHWTAGDRELYYSMSLFDALRTGRKFIIGGSVEERLVDVQMQVLNRLLYEGELNFFGKPAYGWLYYTSSFWAVVNALSRMFTMWLKQPARPGSRGNKPRPATPDSVPNN